MKKLLMTAALTLATSSAAIAAPFTHNVANDVYSGVVNGIPTANDHNDGVPDLFDAANHVLGTSYTSNADLDSRFVEPDSFYLGTGTHSVALIGLTAGNSNTLGVYTDIGVGAARTDVLGPVSGFGIPHAGTAADPYLSGTFDVVGEFGWYLESVSGGGTEIFYSEAGLNSDGIDHMMSFEMSELNGTSVYINSGAGAESYTFSNAFMIGFEDLNLHHAYFDDDYDDMIYIVDFRPVTEVVEPGSLALTGLGLLMFGGLRRRRK